MCEKVSENRIVVFGDRVYGIYQTPGNIRQVFIW